MDDEGVPIHLTLVDGIFNKDRSWSEVLKTFLERLIAHPDWNIISSLYSPILKAFADNVGFNYGGC